MATRTTKPSSKSIDSWIDGQPRKQVAALRQARDQLLRLFKKPLKGDIGWQYNVGKCLLALFPAGDHRRGEGMIERLADLVAPGRDRSKKSIVASLYAWRWLAIRCSSAEVNEFAAKVDSGQITSAHVAYLVSVDPETNTTSRADFLRNCLKHGWSANQLRHEIQDDRRHLTSFGGRHPRPRTTSSPAIAARQVIVLARQWQLCQKQYFFARSAPLRKSLRNCSLRLRRELELALDGLQQVADSAAEARKILASIVDRLPKKETAPRRTRSGR